jgi:L-threonylcarbamoyladenylate synthase
VKTEVRPAAQLQPALDVLKSGGIVAFPTDTVYGVGALAFNNAAIESIYTAKDRPLEKAIPILIGDLKDLEMIGLNIPDMALRLAARFWPGPLTCIIPKSQLSLQPYLPLRPLPYAFPITPTLWRFYELPDPWLSLLPISPAGQSPISAQEVYDQLNGRIPLILDGGNTPGGIPSTLVDCTGETPVILREGPLTMENLISALQ